MTSAQRLATVDLLEQVLHLHQVRAFQADVGADGQVPPGSAAAFCQALGQEVAERCSAAMREELTYPQALAALGELLEALRAVAGSVDRFSQRIMGIFLTHLLADAPVGPQLRNLIMATVTSYAADLQLLRQRTLAAVRVKEEQAAVLADGVCAAAAEVLALRRALLEVTLGLCAMVAGQHLPWVARAARDRSLPEAERRRLRLARVDLQQLQERPIELLKASFEDRLRAHPLPDEEPEPPAEQQADRFALLEID